MPWIGQPLPGPHREEPREAAAYWEQRWRAPEWWHPKEVEYNEFVGGEQRTLDFRDGVD